MEIIQSPTVPRLQQNLWLDSTNNTLNAPTKDGWKSITSSGGAGGGMTKVTHDELVSLRDEGKLTPGALYRITDYVATTAQAGTMSANHPFDIVVVALDEKTLSEDASAIAHSEEDLVKYKSVTWTTFYDTYTAPFLMETNITIQGNKFLCAIFQVDEDHWTIYNPQIPGAIIIDVMTSDFEKTDDGYVIPDGVELTYCENYTIESGYFAYSNLPAWQLKYCLDNDTDRFGWADTGREATPPIEGVPPSIHMYDPSDPWNRIFTRTPNDDTIVNGIQYYGWRAVNNSKSKDYTDPTLDYTNTDNYALYTKTEQPIPEEDSAYSINNGEVNPSANVIDTTACGIPAAPAGNGVIYWMKDEHDNEAPFDFKGITFSLQNVASSDVLQYFLNKNTPLNIEESDYQVYWLTILPTSTADVIEDMSTGTYCCYGNVNKKYSDGLTDLMTPSMVLSLPENIMICYDYSGNGYPVTCIDNSFGENCGGNIVAPTPIGIKLLGANAGNGVFAVNSYGMYATIYPVLSGEFIPINNNNIHVGRDSNGDLQTWNPADLAAKPTS